MGNERSDPFAMSAQCSNQGARGSAKYVDCLV